MPVLLGLCRICSIALISVRYAAHCVPICSATGDRRIVASEMLSKVVRQMSLSFFSFLPFLTIMQQIPTLKTCECEVFLMVNKGVNFYANLRLFS